MDKHPPWWKEGTVVRITDFEKCDLVPQHEEWGYFETIGILGKKDERWEKLSSWREFICLDARVTGPGKSRQHPNGWYWVHVGGVEPVEAKDG